MRILFDASGSTERSGGMRLHSTQIISTWAIEYPADDIHVFGPRWVASDLRFPNVTHHYWPTESVLTRAPGQLVGAAIVASRVKAEAVVSLSPIVTPFFRRGQRIAYQHDWRHLKNPEEFPPLQRIYRWLWARSAGWANLNACISAKAELETRAVAPRSHTVVISNGMDHARTWESLAPRVPGRIVTFGHHNNKRPELLVHAIGLISSPPGVTLVILGARGDYQEELRTLATALNVADRISFPGFVSSDEYESIVSSASLVALVSSDEGFGLPIAEAWWLGIPALITADSGMDGIFEGYPYLAEPDPDSIARAASLALTIGQPTTKTAVPTTWRESVALLRSAASSA